MTDHHAANLSSPLEFTLSPDATVLTPVRRADGQPNGQPLVVHRAVRGHLWMGVRTAYAEWTSQLQARPAMRYYVEIVPGADLDVLAMLRMSRGIGLRIDTWERDPNAKWMVGPSWRHWRFPWVQGLMPVTNPRLVDDPRVDVWAGQLEEPVYPERDEWWNYATFPDRAFQWHLTDRCP